MTPQDQIKALAELDGCHIAAENSQGFNLVLKNGDVVTVWNDETVDGDKNRYCEKLRTSYDAIIPLIQKQPKTVREQIAINLWAVHDIDSDWAEQEAWAQNFLTTPAQLCEALLRATNKWKD